ncbi:MAG: hypothetical protein ABIJ53_04330, partial [Verrucomicrobiota bacterium]
DIVGFEMTFIIYFCVYGYHLLVPGYLIARLLNLRRGRFLLSLALSYALLLLNLIPMEWLEAPLWIFILAFNLQVGFLLFANALVGWRHARVGIAARRRTWSSFLSSITKSCWPPLVIVSGVLIYLVWAGPYIELPADAWRHIGRFQDAWNTCVHTGHIARIQIAAENWMPSNYFMQQGGHWYILHALLCKISGITITDSVMPLTVANTIMFCWSIYWFAIFLWSRHRISRLQKILASLWSVCFTVVWLGVNIFAYIRYYALAPGILNYIIYLAVVVLILDYLRSRSWWSHALWLVPLLLTAMNVIHTQEAVFVCFMGLGMLIVMEGQWIWTKSKYSVFRSQKSEVVKERWFWTRIRNGLTNRRAQTLAMNMLKIHVLFFGGLIIFGLLLFYSLHKPMVGDGYSETVLKPVFQNVFHQQWFIQPPSGQFFQVLTWWGVFVYALFLLYARHFLRQPFILAGMLMPCLTVFNPLTLAILSRWMADPNAIYRFNYMIPLPFVAGFLAMRFSNEIKRWIGAGWRNGMRSSQRDLPAIIVQIKSILWWRGLWAGGCLLGLFILLTPWEPLFGMKSNSRFYTFKPVAEGNDQRRWGDLIALVRTHPQAVILSDQYTSTILHWLGANTTDGDWWLRPASQGADRLALLRNLDRRHDWWLVVNRRNGEFSRNGYISGHWPADVLMRFASFYPEDLILFIKQHPELFKEIWSKDQIQVYDIVEEQMLK